MKSLALTLGVDHSLSRSDAASRWPSKILATLDGIFTAREIVLRVDGEDQPTIGRFGPTSYHRDKLWAGEQVLDDVLTHVTSSESLIAELDARVAGARSIELSVHGALYHLAPGTNAPAFYGRWRHARSLEAFAKVYFSWTEHQREIELVFPLGGYPLTRSRLGANSELQDGDADAARDNASRIVAEASKLRAALGLAPNEITWSQFGDFSSWYPDDAEACERIWLPKLRAA